MQEVLTDVIIYLSIGINVALFLRLIYRKSIVVYRKNKKLRERRFKQRIHTIVMNYLKSIANEK